MKRCPFCAEEIQDAAIVCRFCNRDLSGLGDTPKGRAPTMTHPPVRAYERWALPAAVLILAVVLFGLAWTTSSTPPPATPDAARASATSAAVVERPTSGEAPDPSEATEGKGSVGGREYTYIRGPEGTMFFFTPPIAANSDEALMTVLRHVLATDLGIEGRVTTRIAGPSVRFIAGSGIYDATPVREREGGPVSGLLIQKR